MCLKILGGYEYQNPLMGGGGGQRVGDRLYFYIILVKIIIFLYVLKKYPHVFWIYILKY